jgi:mannose-6-phosphate isomerase class I
LIKLEGERLVRDELFEIQKWDLESRREVVPRGQFAIVCCLSGKLSCADANLAPGEFFLVPTSLQDRYLHPRSERTTLLRITIPNL